MSVGLSVRSEASATDRDPGEARAAATLAFFDAEADRTAALCHRMAERFARGGRLVALASAPAARSDAHHVAVEFAHPVIVGKQALPALAITAAGDALTQHAGLLLRPDDIAIGFGLGALRGADTGRALALARARGCLTVGYGGDAEWGFTVDDPDPGIGQEVIETHYHVLWELVHVFFEHRGLLDGRRATTTHDAGASSFLYPFLAGSESNLDAVLRDVAGSVRLKAHEITELRRQTLGENAMVLRQAARDLRARFDTGGVLLALGNGGSATDAMDAVADLVHPQVDWPARPAIDLTADTAILTALANDIGPAALFARQVIAYGHPGDTVLAFSTSGDSINVIDALAEARRRGLGSIALVGYDGGRIAAGQLADHVVITRSEHIPRIQEAQASAWHRLRDLIELAEC